MSEEPVSPADDRLTIIAMAVLAYILQDLLHEGLGHGVTAWMSGAHAVTLSSVALQSDIDTRWISANGTLVNLAAAAIIWLVLRYARNMRPKLRYFLVLALAGGVFSGTGYFFFSGVTNFGDWAAVIRGLEPHWLWRLGILAGGAALYYASMLVVAAEMRPFIGEDRGRLRRLCWIPYFTEGILAAAAGVLNPAGLFYVIASALPSTMGANTGLFVLPFVMSGWKPRAGDEAGAIRRGPGWITGGVLAALFLILLVGPGISWYR